MVVKKGDEIYFGNRAPHPVALVRRLASFFRRGDYTMKLLDRYIFMAFSGPRSWSSRGSWSFSSA